MLPDAANATPQSRSRGYVPLDLESVDSELSNEALGLLARIRAASDQLEQDGVLDDRDVRVLRAKHNLRRPTLDRLIAELVSGGVLAETEGIVTDLRFGAWCRTHEQREKKRAEWRTRQDQKRRSSRADASRESRTESQTSSVSAASADADAGAATSGHAGANGVSPKGVGEPEEVDAGLIEAEERRRRLVVVARSDS